MKDIEVREHTHTHQSASFWGLAACAPGKDGLKVEIKLVEIESMVWRQFRLQTEGARQRRTSVEEV